MRKGEGSTALLVLTSGKAKVVVETKAKTRMIGRNEVALCHGEVQIFLFSQPQLAMTL